MAAVSLSPQVVFIEEAAVREAGVACERTGLALH